MGAAIDRRFFLGPNVKVHCMGSLLLEIDRTPFEELCQVHWRSKQTSWCDAQDCKGMPRRLFSVYGGTFCLTHACQLSEIRRNIVHSPPLTLTTPTLKEQIQLRDEEKQLRTYSDYGHERFLVRLRTELSRRKKKRLSCATLSKIHITVTW